MSETNTPIKKLLNADELMGILAEISEKKPRDLVVSWYDEEDETTRTFWMGSWPGAIGLVKLLSKHVERAGDDD